jgi:hypothetical protein
MTDPTIRAALEAARLLAAQALGLCELHREIAATLRAIVDERDAAIAAFHRKRAVDCRSVGLIPSAIAHDDLARAVEQAAKESER